MRFEQLHVTLHVGRPIDSIANTTQHDTFAGEDPKQLEDVGAYNMGPYSFSG